MKKLGIDDSKKLLLLNAPADYHQWLERDIRSQLVRSNGKPDIIHLFAKDKRSFLDGMKKTEPYCAHNSSIAIWVSWYKKSSGLASDLTEDTIRAYALQHGLVDIKVCAVSEIWSGLKLVVPLSKRKS